MKSFFATGAALAMTLAFLAADASAQRGPYSSPSLLPVPQYDNRYPTAQTSANYRYRQPIGSGVADPNPADPNNVAPDSLPSETGPMNADTAPNHGNAPEPIPSPNHDGHDHYGDHHTHGGYGAGDGYRGSPYADAMSAPWDGSKSVTGGGCGYGDSCGYGGFARAGWFGGVNGLIMSRDAENQFAFSYVATPFTEQNQLLNNRDANMGWAGGVEARFGRYFGCGQRAWEFVYWGIYPGLQEYTLTNAGLPGPLDGIHNWDQLSIFDPTVPGPVDADNWVNNADAHRLRRNYEFHNIELNLINFGAAIVNQYECASRFNSNWGCGVRYFRFDEDLLFSAKEAGSGTTFDDSINQLNYLTQVDNNLFGFQLNGNSTCRLTNRLSMNMGAKLGLYANHINHRAVIGSGGNIAVVNNGPYDGYQWNISSNKDDVAFLGELNLGLSYQISCRWSATMGYRAVAATGVALAGAQIPNDLRGINDALLIVSNGSLILHGAYAGATFNF